MLRIGEALHQLEVIHAGRAHELAQAARLFQRRRELARLPLELIGVMLGVRAR